MVPNSKLLHGYVQIPTGIQKIAPIPKIKDGISPFRRIRIDMNAQQNFVLLAQAYM